jgi:NACalpha-BTF3-like transcription factor
MSDGSPVGSHGISLLAETALVELVAETLGVQPGPSRIALDATGYDFEEAINLLTYAQWAAPSEVSQPARAASFRDLAQIVANVCEVDIDTAIAVLKAHANDTDAAIDAVITGQWKPEAVSYVETTNSTSCNQCHSVPQNVSSSPAFRTLTDDESDLFLKKEYARYLRTEEFCRILIVHTEDPGMD